jgi:hypothetical protein
MSEPDIYSTYIPIAISIAAFVLSFSTFVLRRKNEQFRIALDLNSKIKEDSDEIVEAISNNEPPEKIRYKNLEYLNTWEFFAFLVNNGEIKNKNILKYFKPSFVSEVKETLEEYRDVAENKAKYEEIRTPLETWGYKIEVKDSPKTTT